MKTLIRKVLVYLPNINGENYSILSNRKLEYLKLMIGQISNIKIALALESGSPE